VSAFIGPPLIVLALSRRHPEGDVGAVPALGDPLGGAALVGADLLGDRVVVPLPIACGNCFQC